MAAVEENWQTKCSVIAQRTTFIFNTDLLSDVKFVVSASIDESESKKVIPAHKFVPAISSPVFYAMFYGQMAETKNAIELPDCDYQSLLEMFHYLYCDKVNLSGDNVMQVLYLANKYMLPSLIEKCTEYLRRNLKASNVFCILPHAQKFENKFLEDRCWEVIEKQTEEAVTSDEFVTVERSLVETTVKKDVLNVREVELFKAVDRWAIEQSKRQGTTPDGESKRRIIGEDIVKAIRFPLMSEKEFASVVIESDILTLGEAGDIMRYFSDLSTFSLPFIQAPRIPRIDASLIHECQRFLALSPPDKFRWEFAYGGSPDCITFTVNKSIMLHGVQHFGSKGGSYAVSTNVKDTTDGCSVVKQSGLYAAKKDKDYSYYCFCVQFERPVCLLENKKYKLESLINGPPPWKGLEGRSSVRSHGVLFTFHSPACTKNRTSRTVGQFPVLFWSSRR